jgi:hypothetical protein
MFKFLKDVANLEQQRELWSKIRARGKKRYVLLWGVGWDSCFFVFTNLLDAFIRHRAVDPWFLPISLPIAVTVGIGGGFSMWNINEQRFDPNSAQRRYPTS